MAFKNITILRLLLVGLLAGSLQMTSACSFKAIDVNESTASGWGQSTLSTGFIEVTKSSGVISYKITNTEVKQEESVNVNTLNFKERTDSGQSCPSAPKLALRLLKVNSRDENSIFDDTFWQDKLSDDDWTREQKETYNQDTTTTIKDHMLAYLTFESGNTYLKINPGYGYIDGDETHAYDYVYGLYVAEDFDMKSYEQLRRYNQEFIFVVSVYDDGNPLIKPASEPSWYVKGSKPILNTIPPASFTIPGHYEQGTYDTLFGLEQPTEWSVDQIAFVLPVGPQEEGEPFGEELRNYIMSVNEFSIDSALPISETVRQVDYSQVDGIMRVQLKATASGNANIQVAYVNITSVCNKVMDGATPTGAYTEDFSSITNQKVVLTDSQLGWQSTSFAFLNGVYQIAELNTIVSRHSDYESKCTGQYDFRITGFEEPDASGMQIKVSDSREMELRGAVTINEADQNKLEVDLLKFYTKQSTQFDIQISVTLKGYDEMSAFIYRTIQVDLQQPCAPLNVEDPSQFLELQTQITAFTARYGSLEWNTSSVESIDLFDSLRTSIPRSNLPPNLCASDLAEGNFSKLRPISYLMADGTTFSLDSEGIDTSSENGWVPTGDADNSVAGVNLDYFPLWIDTTGTEQLFKINRSAEKGTYTYQIFLSAFKNVSSELTLTDDDGYKFELSFKIVEPTPLINPAPIPPVADDEADDEADMDALIGSDTSTYGPVFENQDDSYTYTPGEELVIALPEAVAEFGQDGNYKLYELKVNKVDPKAYLDLFRLEQEESNLYFGPVEQVEGVELDQVTVIFEILNTETLRTEYASIMLIPPFDQCDNEDVCNFGINVDEIDTIEVVDGKVVVDGEVVEEIDGDKSEYSGLIVIDEDDEVVDDSTSDTDENTDNEKEDNSDDADYIGDVKELKDVKIDLENLESSAAQIFTGELAGVSTERKQEIFSKLLKAKMKKEEDKSAKLPSKQKPKKPELAFEPVYPDGSFSMLFDRGMNGLEVVRQINVEIKTRGTVSSQFADDETEEKDQDLVVPARRRLQESEQKSFDLGKYMSFALRRGDEDSAPAEELDFTAVVESLEGDKLNIQLQFDNPLSVSIGSRKDQVVGTVQDESFFTSSESGLSIEKGFQIKTWLPKLLENSGVVTLVQDVKQTVENTAQSLMTGQLLVTLALSVSLKSMWNLFNVMQVMAYLRSFTPWPALIQIIIKNIYEAIYLKQVNDAVMNYGKSKFEVAKKTTKDEYLINQGIESDDTLRNLGIFAISIGLLLLVVFVYYITRALSCFKKIKTILQKKIFYNGPIRYVIVSYLKLFNQFVTLLLLAIANYQGAVPVVINSLVLLFLVAWPLWTNYFLIKNQNQLHTESYQQKFESLFQGINLNSFGALCYNGVFSVRRYDLILLNVYFTVDSPMSGADRNMYFFKVVGFLVIQTFYLMYIHAVRPHKENVFNIVEFVNEYSLVALGYAMLSYTSMTPVKQADSLTSGVQYTVICIIGFMVVVNFSVMIRMSVLKICASLKRKKALKTHKEKMDSREALEQEKKAQEAAEKAQKSKTVPTKKVKLNRFNRVKLSKEELKKRRMRTMTIPDTTVITKFEVVHNNFITNNINITPRQIELYEKNRTKTSERKYRQEQNDLKMTDRERRELLEFGAKVRHDLERM